MRSMGLILAAGMALLACEPGRDDLTVHWTFENGRNCAQVGVATIQVDVEGEVLTPNRFSCSSGNTVNEGAYLGRFLDGLYTVTLTGLDGANAAIYSKTVDVRVVRRGTDVTIDLGARQATSGALTLHWKFDGATCAQAQVSSVQISIDGEVITDLQNNANIPCTQDGVDGATIEPLSPGHHTVDLTGIRGGVVRYQLTSFDAVVIGGQDTLNNVNLLPSSPTAGYADIAWTFEGKTCAQAGVTSVDLIYDGAFLETVPCHNGNVDGVFIEDVPPGQHTWAIRGIIGSQFAYRTATPVTKDFAVGLTTWIDIDAVRN